MIDPNSVVGAVTIIIASVILFFQNRKQTEQVKKQAKDVTDVKSTLTQSNGGTHVKDYLDVLTLQLGQVIQHNKTTDERLFRIETLLMDERNK